MTVDLVNSLWAVASCLFMIPSVVSAYRHKKVVGMHWVTPAFFSCSCCWNIYFFWSLGQFSSMGVGGALLVINLLWFVAVAKYGRDD